ncbi:hypothetical protein F3Y22_tig00001644pilonHSYRG00525 [Hibiscus syriacus]|uniref:Uncharacterized protein n=1 Tax=Hibiscus syriacus TaxID=106335 RepID=A0A6A3CU25_HIBSY|nr:hypothetical protein F3Y22_tig00001644pilonHSYRG00525 [Hibiscus syriacus]
MFPKGIIVLSFFSGISGAKIALYQLSIYLKADVKELNDDRLEQLMSRFGGFDLVVDGIPYNNLTGRNKHHRDVLENFCWCIAMTTTVTVFFIAPRYALPYPTLPEP